MIRQHADRNQISLYSSLDDLVAPDAEVRLIDFIIKDILGKSDLDYSSGKGKSHTGRPAYSFSTMLKIFIYGYINRIKSSRKLEIECKRNIELMWLTGKQTPDHGTLCNFREAHGEEISSFSKQFRQRLKELSLFKGEYAIDGSRFKANVNPANIQTLTQLNKRHSEIEQEMRQYLEQLAQADKDKGQGCILKSHEALIEKKDALERELKGIEEKLEFMKSEERSSYSPIDDDCRRMKTNEGIVPGYNAQIAVDTETKFIATDEVTNESADRRQLKPITESLCSELSEKETTVIADKGYCKFDDIEEIEESGDIQCYVSPQDNWSKDRNDFIYDKEKDCYYCPEGKVLEYSMERKSENGKPLYVYQCLECDGCPRRKRCTKSKVGRTLNINHNEEFRIAYKEKMKSEESKKMMTKRKSSVECVFGTIKILAGKIPILTRGIKNVGTEIKLYCLAYNIKHLMSMFTLEELMEKIASLSPNFSVFLILSKIWRNFHKIFFKINLLTKSTKFYDYFDDKRSFCFLAF